MSRKVLLRERRRYENLAEDVLSVAATVGIMLVGLAYFELAERQADTLLAIYIAIILASLVASTSDKVVNMGVVALSMAAVLTQLTLTTVPMLILHGVSGVKKYWRIQMRHYFKVIRTR